MGGYYSPGKMTIDDTYIISHGGHKMLYTFQKSFNTEGKKPFQYVYTSKDSKDFGDWAFGRWAFKHNNKHARTVL